MSNITTITDLKSAIQQLENSQASEWIILKQQFLATAKTLKPVNILGDAVKNILASPDLKKNVVNTVFGLTTGLAATKLAMGKTTNPVSNLVVGAIMGIITSTSTSKAVAEIKSIGLNLLKKIIQRKTLKEHNG
jgi:hypothetical protein